MLTDRAVCVRFAGAVVRRVASRNPFMAVDGRQPRFPAFDPSDIWMRRRGVTVPEELSSPRRRPWTVLMCGVPKKQDSGVLSSAAIEIGQWPYREYLGLDLTVWTRRDGARRVAADYHEWCKGRRTEPSQMTLAVEHENEPFAARDDRELGPLPPASGKYYGNLDHSIAKLAHVRVPGRILIGYPAREIPGSPDEIEGRDLRARSLAAAEIGRFFGRNEDRGTWLVLFGYCVGDGRGKPHLEWRASVLSAFESTFTRLPA